MEGTSWGGSVIHKQKWAKTQLYIGYYATKHTVYKGYYYRGLGMFKKSGKYVDILGRKTRIK